MDATTLSSTPSNLEVFSSSTANRAGDTLYLNPSVDCLDKSSVNCENMKNSPVGFDNGLNKLHLMIVYDNLYPKNSFTLSSSLG